jgi:KaiC/GvpD/RAD55 family RecA-like ATPase
MRVMPKKTKAKAAKKAVKASERIPTGVNGLDKLLEGGLMKGSTTLLAGGTGTGKTIFCCQFIMEGLKRGEKCFYITLEESPEDIINDVKEFGWDMKKYVDNGQLIIKYEDPFEVTNISRGFLDHIRAKGYKRVAIDSTSVLGLYFKSPFEVRKQLFLVLTALKKTGATVMITAESPEEGRTITRFGVEEYITDGVIVLHYTGFGGGTYYSLQVRKMRRTNHGKDVYPMIIGPNGIEVKKLE